MTPQVRDAAAAWWSAMRGPDADRRRAAFEAWLAEDPAHAREYDRLDQAWDAAAALAGSQLGRERRLTRQRPRWIPSVPVAAIAATACALLVALFLVGLPGAHRETASAQLLTLRSPIGEIRSHTLPDGSVVTLDTDSTVAVRFDAQTRRVTLLSGRARFEVREDASRPFVADAAGVAIAGAKTRFDAELRSEGLVLSCLAGAITVRPDRDPGATGFGLGPDRMVLVGAAGKPLIGPLVPRQGSEKWVSGMLVFQSTPLAQVLAQTNRYSERRITLGSPGLGELRVTGTFRPLPVDKLAASLAAAFDLEVRREAGGHLLLMRP